MVVNRCEYIFLFEILLKIQTKKNFNLKMIFEILSVSKRDIFFFFGSKNIWILHPFDQFA